MSAPQWIVPEWPAPHNVRSFATLRGGGVSSGSFSSLNLATHVGDDPAAVLENRALLAQSAQLPAEPIWLNQVHGNDVWTEGARTTPPTADACVAHSIGAICTILTADCLPILLCDLEGTTVGAAHAGWRGLAGGIIERTVRAMRADPARLMAWLGPAIEPEAFEVGDEVRETFLNLNARHATAFEPNARGRWQADLYALARTELDTVGVTAVYGGGFRCVGDADRFFSYRRDKQTGRMATMIWLAR